MPSQLQTRMKSLETAFDFISLENTWNPDTHFRTQSIWFPLKNLSDPVTIAKHHHYQLKQLNFCKGRPNTVFPTIKRHEIHLFLSLFAHIYVSIGQKYSVSKAFFSLLICMYWPSRTSTPSQSEIFCLIAWTLLAFPLFIRAEREYFTLGGCAGLGRPIHTYEQREKGLWDRIFLANTDIHTSRPKVAFLQFYYYIFQSTDSTSKIS